MTLPRLRLPAAYAYVMLAVLSLIVGAVAILYSASYTNSTGAKLNAAVAQLRAQQLAACGSAGDIGSIPIPDKPRPSRLGVSLVTDSRAEWRALHCPGTLPVPPGLAKWARYYRVPVN